MLFALGALIFLFVMARPGAALEDRLACGLLLLIVSGPLLYPSMLRGDGEDVSAMRVVVYIIVGVFSVLTFRLGWRASTLAELKIDPWWTGIVTVAIGGKAAQSFAERSADPAAAASASGLPDGTRSAAGGDRVPTPPPVPARPAAAGPPRK